MGTKLGKVVNYSGRLTPLKSLDPLITWPTWSHFSNWKIISPLSQVLWPLNLAWCWRQGGGSKRNISVVTSSCFLCIQLLFRYYARTLYYLLFLIISNNPLFVLLEDYEDSIVSFFVLVSKNENIFIDFPHFQCWFNTVLSQSTLISQEELHEHQTKKQYKH